jgi:hypothetical protein
VFSPYYCPFVDTYLYATLPLPLRSILTFVSAIMNNQQFRRLVLDTPSASTRANKTSPVDETSPKQDAGVAGATPRALALGSRMRSSIPMTPYVTPSCHPGSSYEGSTQQNEPKLTEAFFYGQALNESRFRPTTSRPAPRVPAAALETLQVLRRAQGHETAHGVSGSSCAAAPRTR